MTVPASPLSEYPGPARRRALRVLSWPIVVVAQLVRVVLRKVLWIVLRSLRLAWRHLLITVVVALGAYYAYRALAPSPLERADEPPVRAVPVIAPPASVRTYLDAQREFDAERMWQTLSPDAKAQRLASGETLASFRRSLELLREQGYSFGESHYVGGYSLPDGQAYYFYVTEIRNAIDQRALVYQIFWVDSDGLIFLVDTPQLQ